MYCMRVLFIVICQYIIKFEQIFVLIFNVNSMLSFFSVIVNVWGKNQVVEVVKVVCLLVEVVVEVVVVGGGFVGVDIQGSFIDFFRVRCFD